jgi:hypothetical protein
MQASRLHYLQNAEDLHLVFAYQHVPGRPVPIDHVTEVQASPLIRIDCELFDYLDQGQRVTFLL